MLISFFAILLSQNAQDIIYVKYFESDFNFKSDLSMLSTERRGKAHLVVSYNYNYLQFDYTLDIEVPRDKINELQKLINFVNQKTKNGFFIYDLEADKVKFYIIKQYFVKLKNEIIEDVIEENLNLTNYLFRNFTLATHNLIFAEKTDQNYIELMFMEVEGYA